MNFKVSAITTSLDSGAPVSLCGVADTEPQVRSAIYSLQIEVEPLPILNWLNQKAKIGCETDFEFSLATGGSDNLVVKNWGGTDLFLKLEGNKLIMIAVPDRRFNGQHEFLYENGWGTIFLLIIDYECKNRKLLVEGVIETITKTGLITVKFYPDLLLPTGQ